MKQLELQQQAEEQALLAASDGSPASSSNGESSKHNGPVRSRSGNDLAGFGAAAAASAAAASAKSMPGSRRHSGELKDGKEEKEGGARRGHVQDKEGKPMLNSFLFDDELDADLQSTSLSTPTATLMHLEMLDFCESWLRHVRTYADLRLFPQTRLGEANTSK